MCARWQEFVSGLWNQAFYLTGDDTLRVVDSGASPLDVDNVLMVAWVMPTDFDVVADRGIVMNKSVPAGWWLLAVFGVCSVVADLVARCCVLMLFAVVCRAAGKARTSSVFTTAQVCCKEPSHQAAGAGGALRLSH